MAALITGANGQLGRALHAILPDAIVTDRSELDVTDPQSVARFDFSNVDAIYNAAAYTAVDQAEQPGQIPLAWTLNATAVSHLAAAARAHDIPLVHISTDYVFDGQAKEPYREGHAISPQSIYGLTKAAGELAAQIAPKHYLVRTSWLFGDGPNFVRTMLKLGRARKELTVVSDQVGRPTYAGDLATALTQLVTQAAPNGTYHFQNAGEVISWAEFAEAIFKAANLSCRVVPISSAEYAKDKPDLAPRPGMSALALEKVTAAGIKAPEWEPALAAYIKQEDAA